jgi:TP901 family phage tail tape measure protein
VISADQIVVWIRARDARRFQAEMARSAASVREVGAAGATSGRKLGVMGRGMALVTKSLKIGSLAILGIAAEATKMGVNFDSAMLRIQTQAGESTKRMGYLRNAVLDMSASGQFQQGPQELVDALYRLEGAGLRGAEAMRALRAAADLAAVGNANVEDTAKTMAQTLFVGMKGTGNVRQLVAELNATVGAGDLKLQQLVDALGTGVTASAKQAGLSFHDVTGALAVFGDETNNVSGWAAQFATALHFLYAPTQKAAQAMKTMGLSKDALARDMAGPNGLVTALGDLRDHLNSLPGGPHGVKARQLLSDILPGGRGRVLLVLLNQLDRLQGKMHQIQGTNKDFESSVRKNQQQPLFRLRAAWAQVESAMIRFYDVIKPLVIPVLIILLHVLAATVTWLTATGKHVQAIVKWWNGLPAPVKLAAEALGIFLAQGLALFAIIRIFGMVRAGLLAVRYGIMIVRGAMILLTLGSGPMVLALMALVTIAVLIITHWSQVKPIVMAVWNWMKTAARDTGHWVSQAFTNSVNWIKNAWHNLIGWFRGIPRTMRRIFTGMWDGIKTAFRTAINWVIGAWDKLHFRIGGWHVGPIHVPTVTVGLPQIPMLASGGTIPTGGLAVVGDRGPELASVGPRGARITPLARSNAQPSLGGAFRFHFEIPVVVGGREVARATADQTSDWNARRGK